MFKRYVSFARITTLFLLLPLLGGCITNNPRPTVVEGRTPTSDGVMTAVVAPGKAGMCRVTPCRVYYHTPDAGGPVEVVVNNQVVGSFPSNTLVSLGDFSDSMRISITGSDAPTAFVNMPNTNR
jgi:hypothetical protein